MEKNEIINRLYALRAGLSVLSQANDKIVELNAAENRYVKFLATYKGCPTTSYECESYYEAYDFVYGDKDCTASVKEKVDKIIGEYGKKRSSAASMHHDVGKIEKEEREELRRTLVFTRFTDIDYTEINALSLPAEKAVAEYNKGVEKYGDAFITEANTSKVEASMKDTFRRWLYTKESCTHYGKVWSALQDYIAEHTGAINKIKKNPFYKLSGKLKFALAEHSMRLSRIQDAVQVLDKVVHLVQQWQTEGTAAIDNIELMQRDAVAFFDALCVEFTPILDVRDWGYLDLVLFYLETRRADTLKEALQQVDTEVRARRLESTIKEAAEQIRSTISYGLSTIRDSVETCSANISSQLAAQHAQTSAQISQLTNAVSLGNALQAKANVTSEQLMKDVHYIRTSIF